MKILSLGDLLLDVVISFDPATGEADTAPDAVQLWPGGSAANFAVWAARGGADVTFVSQAGRDWSGDMLVRSLEAEGVTPYVRVVDDTPTGRVLVMVDPDGVRRMWSYPGASASLDPAALDPAWFRGLDAFHLTGYSLLHDGPRAAALRALRLARANSTAFCTLDPNPSHLIDDYGPALYYDLLRDLRFDAIFPNLEEGRLLTKMSDPADVASTLLELSPLVVLTLGESGCMVACSSGTDLPAQLSLVPAHAAARVLDTTGAGDAFAAGFVIEYLRTRDPLKAAAAANRTAASVVARFGAR